MASPRIRPSFFSPTASSSVWLALLLTAICLTASAWSSPLDAAVPSEIPVEVQMPMDQVVYDQRQNGSENLRVQMTGVTVVLAPAEALLALAPQDLIDSGGKPKSSQPKSRLSNLLMGFLNKGRNANN